MPPGPNVGIDPDAEAMYRHARDRLAAEDLDTAAQWLERAAARGHPAAMTELAIVCLHGFARDADPARALELLECATDVGGPPEASWLLAQLVMGGVLAPFVPARVDALLADAARRGFPAALRVAGVCFGRDPEPAMQQAASECLRRASALRDPVAAALYADRLHAGIGARRDADAANDLAARLRGAGIPVELPAPTGAVGTDDVVACEPDWARLRHEREAHPLRTELAAAPEIATFDEVLSDEECRYVIYAGARYLDRSQVIHPQTGQQLEKGLRSSRDMNFAGVLDELGIAIMQRRLAHLAGFALANCEPLTLLHYGPGEEYRPHRDYFLPSAPQLAQPGGQRHSTVCVYLNEVERGGETAFPDRHVVARPQRGRAVMFRNLDAGGRPEPRSLHAGLPVLIGEKWLSTCWARQHPLRAF